jgi:hypothetical protein
MKRQCVDRKKTRFNDAELTGGREKTLTIKLSINQPSLCVLNHKSPLPRVAAARFALFFAGAPHPLQLLPHPPQFMRALCVDGERSWHFHAYITTAPSLTRTRGMLPDLCSSGEGRHPRPLPASLCSPLVLPTYSSCYRAACYLGCTQCRRRLCLL